MSPQEIIDPNKVLLALEECEKRIFSACRRGREATQAIGKELTRIKDQELFKARHDFFQQYVEEDLHLDIGSAYRIMHVYDTLQGLEGEGLMLPENESQVIELSRLERDQRIPVWKRIILVSEKNASPITVETIKIAVDQEEKRGQRPAAGGLISKEKTKSKGVEISLDDNDKTPLPKQVIALSEKGEAALARIRRACGDDVGDAIEALRVPISERDLIRWAELDVDKVHNLANYVVNERWTVDKAIKYEDQMIDGDTKVDRLIFMARARSGRLIATHDDARITVEILTA